MVFRVYVEVGAKRTFAGAIDWPGWCRGGKDEASALEALIDYGPRYARVLQGRRLKFIPPEKLSDLKVVERLKGGTSTDFGAPERAPKQDARKMDKGDLQRSEELLRACWHQFDAAAKAARGKKLRMGPRGGGRDLTKMVEHVREAEEAYVERLGWWRFSGEDRSRDRDLAGVREAALKAIRASARGHIPAAGPRGGKRWTARYFVRRAAWHVLDHAWEIQDRAE
jgi:hypothetical protein